MVVIEPIAAAGPTALQAAGGSAPAALERPTASEGDAFSKAVRTHAIAETPAVSPATADGLSGRLLHQADALTAHLGALAPASSGRNPPDGATVADPAARGLDGARQKTDDAVTQIERAYMFAIETTMASRGSTETTKIFNTLLKGQ